MEESNGLFAPPPALRLRWDVFLSFRGEDTRDNITDRLYTALQRAGVRVFRDNEGLTQGDSLAPTLLDAIEDSAASIAIISPNYASSRWCLEELAKICECRRLVLPVFYRVDPSDVRRQQGPFKEGILNLEARFGGVKVRRWRNAMEKVGGISGWVFHRNSDEPQLIQALVKRVLTELSNTPMAVAQCIVGLNFRVEELMGLLDVKSGGIQVLGLHGMGGIGKTTLAKAIYNKLVSRFEHRIFISNVRETSAKRNGLILLQNKLINALSLGRVSPVNDINAGKIAIRDILGENQVLVVLDDVNHISQLDALLGKKEYFSVGSRIIISTRDREALPTHLVNKIYEVKGLGSSDSIKLFSYHALRREKPTETYLKLSQRIVSLTGGLPLALEVFGSFLFDKRRVEEWEDAVQKLQQIRPNNLQDVLKISFDGLDEQLKCVFLDIACLFLNFGMNRDDAIDIIKGCGFSAEIAIDVLVARSLIKVTEDGTLWMHDQIRDMGRQIVLHENIVDPGMRSRLWDQDEIFSVLQNMKGTRCVQGIILDLEENSPKDKSAKAIAWNNLRETPNFTSMLTYLKEMWKEYLQRASRNEGDVIISSKAFESMINLRLLTFGNVTLEGSFKYLPAELKWLQWKRSFLRNLPYNFCPKGLTVLDLSESKIESVWGRRWWSWHSKKVAEKLMVLNLHGCHRLTAIPDLSGHHALEKLILERCSRLSTIHKSIGDASTLRHLNLRECSSLVEFPRDVSGLKNLEILILSGCSNLKDIPEDIGSMHSLRELLLDQTAIKNLPESIFQLTKLERLTLKKCHLLKRLPMYIGKLYSLREFSLDGSALEEIPNSIGLLGNLETLSLMWCKYLTTIPDSVCNLKSLTRFWLNGSSVQEMPASIGSLSYLKNLSAGNCQYIRTLPASIEGLSSMVELQLDGTSIMDLPDQIGALKSLRKFEMRNCFSLSSLPESIGNMLSLHTLIIVNASITELPEGIGMLENLITLRLNQCKQLSRLPASFGKLRSLCHLHMEETSVTELPENFGMLPSLMILKMAKKPYHVAPQHAEITDPRALSAVKNPKPILLPSSFSNLSLLEQLDARAWKFSGAIPDDFEKLSSLEKLNLGHNDFCSLPSSLRGLSVLKELLVPHCKELKFLPPLPSSLVEINAANCAALRSISDLSNLESLQNLNLANCEKLMDIPGLECLKSLQRLHMSGCTSCSSVVKRKLNKAALKNLYSFSMPGSEIPDWFTQEVINFSKRKNRVLKGVIIAVVVSINHQIPHDLRDELPVIPDVQAKIIRLNEPIHTTVPFFAGVANTDEDQVYLCRYLDHRPLVSMLKDGDQIQVAMRNPPFTKGVELKKYGIHLVFENDDDYEGDEESLNENQQSVSERLTRFVASSGGNNRIADLGHEVEGRKEGGEQRAALVSSNNRDLSVLPFAILSSIFVLLSWLVYITCYAGRENKVM